MSMIRSKWAALGAAVAVTLGAGGISLTQAAVGTGEKPVYISLGAPCRVIDTRSGSPIGAGDAAALTVQITGANGACTGELAIPGDAVGVSTNVTVIQPNAAPSGRSYFTVYPNGATRPITSNLNFVNGQAPTPNKVDVGIGTGGQIIIYNNEGTAHAAVDIFGYYVDHTHDDRYYTEGEVDTALATKANAADVYTEGEVDAGLGVKANTADVYTKSEIDLALLRRQAYGGYVGALGDKQGQGSFTSSRSGTGNYLVTYDFTGHGIPPTWMPMIVVASPASFACPSGAAAAYWNSYTTVGGFVTSTSVNVRTSQANTPFDCGFTFIATFAAPDDVVPPVPAGEGALSEPAREVTCVNADGTAVCD